MLYPVSPFRSNCAYCVTCLIKVIFSASPKVVICVDGSFPYSVPWISIGAYKLAASASSGSNSSRSSITSSKSSRKSTSKYSMSSSENSKLSSAK